MAEAEEHRDLGKEQKTRGGVVTLATTGDRKDSCRDRASPREQGGNKLQDHRGTKACRENVQVQDRAEQDRKMAGRRTTDKGE